MVVLAKAAFNIHSPNKPFLVCNYEVPHSILLAPLSPVSWSCYQYAPKSSWIPCYPSTDVKVIQVVWRRPHLLLRPNRAVCSKHTLQHHPHLICLLILTQQLNPDPSPVPGQNCMQAILMLSHIKGHLPSPPSWPVLSKQPESIHGSTLIVWNIPSCLCKTHVS